MSEIESPGPQELPPPKDEVSEIERKVRRVFPEYSIVDREEYDATPLDNNDLARGKVLKFHTPGGSTIEDPRMQFIFRIYGFHLNYYNSESNSGRSVRNRSDSIYAPSDKGWQVDEADLALEAARVHMEGVDPEDTDFRSQLVAWVPTERRYMSLGEKMDLYEDYKGMKKGRSRSEIYGKIKDVGKPWDLLAQDPAIARDLAVRRILVVPAYIDFEGQRQSSSEIARRIRSGAEDSTYVTREINVIAAQESLLQDHGFLPR